jgi:hypothetical protein
MIDRVVSIVVAMSLALLVWLYARGRDQEILDNVPIPVQITLAESQADHYSLDVNGPSQAVVSFSGPPARIHELRGLIQRNELHIEVSLTVPEERVSEGRYSDAVHIEASDVQAPPGVTPIVVEGRNRIPFTLHRLVERPLKVRFDSIQEAPAGTLVLEPATVLVRGPQEVLDHIHTIPTQPSELPRCPAGAAPTTAAVGRVALVQELEGRPIQTTPAKITVRVQPQVRQEYELTDVPVQFLCPADFTLRPQFFDERSGRVTLRVKGPVREEPPKVYAYIDLTHGHYLTGANHEPLQIQYPKDFEPAEEEPQHVVTFDLQQADFVPKGLHSPP